MPTMKLGTRSFTPCTPDAVDEIRNGTDRKDIPYEFRYTKEDIPFEDLVDGVSIHTTMDPATDDFAYQWHESVLSANVGREQAAQLGMFQNIVRIEYREGSAKTIPKDILAYNDLRCLVLNGLVKMTALPTSLKKLKNLEAFEAVNMYVIWDISILESLPGLRFLNLNGTPEIKDYSALAALTNLEELQLQSQDWTKIPDAIKELPNLKRLHISWGFGRQTDISVLDGLGIEEFSLEYGDRDAAPDFYTMPNLKKLRLERPEFDRWDSIAKLKNLEVLEYERPYSSELPKEFAELENLRFLSLLQSDVVTDLSVIANLPIEKLDLGHMKFDAVPEAVGQLSSLKELNLGNISGLKNLDALAGLKNLEVLNLTGFKGTEYPEFLNSLPNLRVLTLTDTQVPLEPLANHPSLDYVSLGWRKPEIEIPGTRFVEHQSGLLFER